MMTSKFPAGLIDNNGELFSVSNLNFALIGGRCIPEPEFPSFLTDTIDNSITKMDRKSLADMGIHSVTGQRHQWLKCNVSMFDNIPDYVYGMNKLQREHVVCDLRGSCKQEKKLCRTLPQISGLTNRQIQVLKLIGRGLLNKEIAAELGISLLTVISHTKNIRDRKNLFRKSDLALYAQQLNLIGEDQTLHTRL